MRTAREICESKKTYKKEHWATQAARKHRGQFTYKCRICPWWHLTSSKPDPRRESLTRCQRVKWPTQRSALSGTTNDAEVYLCDWCDGWHVRPVQ